VYLPELPLNVKTTLKRKFQYVVVFSKQVVGKTTISKTTTTT
jgi:hypothetical protein